MGKLLTVENLEYSYGGIRALRGISFEVEEKEIVTIIGANGAGKTTTLRAISGLLGRIGQGQVRLAGEDITRLPSHRIVERGMVNVLEGRMLFPYLTVRENLEMGAYLCRDKRKLLQRLEYCFDVFPRIYERQRQKAGTLSGGEQQMVAVARALMAGPKLLLMDEPSMGLAPLVVQAVFDAITRINQDGVTILLVEQNANAALHIASRAYVLEVGQVVMSGKAEDLAKDDNVRKTYLGL